MPKGGRGTGGSAQPAATTPADMLDLSEGHPKGGRVSTALWVLGVLALVTGLVLQIGWWDRAKWLQTPQVRAAADAVCQRVGCRVELPRLAGTMEILHLALTERVETPAGLRLTLAMVNKADASQPPPQIQLELYNEKKELVAARRFGPELYLPTRIPGQVLVPSEVVRPTLDLEAPPKPASGFRVKLF